MSTCRRTMCRAIKIGAKAVISVPEYPNRTFAATVEASSQSVDIGSGTTRMQLARQRQGRADAGRLANVRMSLQRDTDAAAHPRQRADLRQERHAGRHRRPRRQGAVQDRHHRPRSRQGHRDSPPASRRTTASSIARPTASPTATRSASPASTRAEQNPRRLRRSRAARGRGQLFAPEREGRARYVERDYGRRLSHRLTGECHARQPRSGRVSTSPPGDG